MDALWIAALVSVSIWLGGLTLLLILTIRQVGLVTARLDRLRAEPQGPSGQEVLNDGLLIGTVVPDAVTKAVPECANGFAYLLLVSSICTPCRELVAELQRRRFHPLVPLVALVPGPPEAADDLVAMLPPAIRAVRDPEAGVLAQEHLQLRSTPFALLIEDGILAGKAYLQTADDLDHFIKSRATSDASEIVRRARKSKEVASHVA